MTRQRSTYTYGAQTVSSVRGDFRLESSGGAAGTVTLLRDGDVSWSAPMARSSKQIFVADDGTSAVLDAADTLTFRAADGALIGEASLLDLASAPVMRSTAGPSWEDYVAATFVANGTSTAFIVSGRDVPPFAIDPSTLSRV